MCDFEAACTAVGIHWQDTAKEQVEALLEILPKGEQERVWDNLLEKLLIEYDNEIWKEAYYRKR